MDDFKHNLTPQSAFNKGKNHPNFEHKNTMSLRVIEPEPRAQRGGIHGDEGAVKYLGNSYLKMTIFSFSF